MRRQWSALVEGAGAPPRTPEYLDNEEARM